MVQTYTAVRRGHNCRLDLLVANEPERADFSIEIEFDKGSRNPARVFETMSELIGAFEALDVDLAVSVHSKVETVLLLEDVEAGSIRTRLSSLLTALPDDILRSGEAKVIIGHFLVASKHMMLRFLGSRAKITSQIEIQELQESLLELAKETGVRQIPAYAPIQIPRLLRFVGNVTQAVSHLSEEDKAALITYDQRTSFNRNFEYNPEEVEGLITVETITNESTMILKVKKPDYLGESMWEFKHGPTAVAAKIVDEGWLKEFQGRKVNVGPGDSLRVRIEQSVKYDTDHNMIATRSKILKVIEVINQKKSDQSDMFDGDVPG